MAEEPEQQGQSPQIPTQLQGVLDENPLQVDVCIHENLLKAKTFSWPSIQDVIDDNNSVYNDSAYNDS